MLYNVKFLCGLQRPYKYYVNKVIVVVEDLMNEYVFFAKWSKAWTRLYEAFSAQRESRPASTSCLMVLSLKNTLPLNQAL